MVNKSVLVVERDPAEAGRIVAFFRDLGFRNRVDVVHSKAEAVDYVFGTGAYAGLAGHAPPGLILLDLETNRTPDVRKLEPLQAYLRTRNIPIVVLTSSAEQEAQVADAHVGVVGFVRKPLDFTQLVGV